jgi:hypothetical protein
MFPMRFEPTIPAGERPHTYALGPVHTSVISPGELAAVTHVNVAHSFTCVRETGRAFHSTARKVMSTRICETVPLRSRRDLR